MSQIKKILSSPKTQAPRFTNFQKIDARKIDKIDAPKVNAPQPVKLSVKLKMEKSQLRKAGTAFKDAVKWAVAAPIAPLAFMIMGGLGISITGAGGSRGSPKGALIGAALGVPAMVVLPIVSAGYLVKSAVHLVAAPFAAFKKRAPNVD